MGLDAVEFVMALETTFGIAIPDADAVALLTPLDVVRYLERRVSGEPVDGCLEQRAFYRVRRAAIEVLDQPRSTVTPSARWDDLLDSKRQSNQWRLLGRSVGAGAWPFLKSFFSWKPPTQRVEDTVRALVSAAPGAFMRGFEGWNRQMIEDAVRRLMAEELGITKFNWTDRFGKDLGVA